LCLLVFFVAKDVGNKKASSLSFIAAKLEETGWKPVIPMLSGHF